MSDPLLDPRKRADEYEEKKVEEEKEKYRPLKKEPKTAAQWATAASEAIEEAMRAGSFDKLPGHGKPLNLNRDPFTPSDSALAFDILRNNDLTPGWLGNRNEILREVEKWRTRLRDLVALANQDRARAATPDARAAAEQRWQNQRRTLQLQVEEFNRRIGTINLQMPTVSMEVFKLRLDEEVRKAGGISQE